MQVAKGPLVVRGKTGFKNVPSMQHMRRRTAVVMTSKTAAAPSLLPLLSPAAVHHPFSSAPSSAIAAAFGARSCSLRKHPAVPRKNVSLVPY
jgi:hypothetical protein